MLIRIVRHYPIKTLSKRKTMNTPASSSTLSNQRNSFFLGLIFGLITGLIIALAVAFYIKQGPKPFLSEHDLNHNTEYFHRNDTDPDINLILAGTQPAFSKKNIKKIVSQTSKNIYELRQPEILEVDNDEIKENIIITKNNVNKSIPLDKTNLSSEQTSQQTEIKVEYFLQIGAFRKKDDAEKQRAEIALAGIKANIINERSLNGFYRVRLGPFDEKKLGIQRKNLEQAQIKYIIIRSSKKL